MGGVAASTEEAEYLDKGLQVEVSTDEEGFKGAWYVATVLKSASKKKNQNSNRIHVEYQTLLADENGSKPLREHVNTAFVRPLPPPPEADIVQAFQLNDVVDAFYRDGWWTGVITRVLDNSRFVVTFQNPPDEIEFGLSELRVHREWVDGEWILPEKQRTTGLMFSTRKNVEVSFDEEDYHDAWFPAVVLEEFGNNSVLVKYQSPGIDSEAGFLKVTVDSRHIRPSPPHLKDKNFVLLEKVDAFYNFGWWSGVITKELADRRYTIFFKHTNKEREFSYSELRPHMDWVDGNWVSGSQGVIPSDYQEIVGHGCNSGNNTEMDVQLGRTCAAEDYSEERTPCSLYSRENQTNQSTSYKENPPSYGMTSLKKKKKLTNADSDASHLRPSKKLKEGNAPKAPSLTSCQLDTTPIKTQSQETLCGFASPTGTNCSKQPMVDDQPSDKTENPSRGKTVQSKQQKVGELENHRTVPVKRKGRQQKSQVKSPQSSAGGKEGNAGANTAEEFVKKECITKEIDLPVLIGLESNGMRGSQAKMLHHFPNEEFLKLMRDQKQQLDDPARHKIKEISQLEGGESNQKKRRGRPPKLQVKSPKASVSGKVHDGDVVAADEVVVKDCITSEGELPTITGEGSTRMKLIGDDKKLLNGPLRHKNKLSSIKKMPSAKKNKLPDEKVVQASSKQLEKNSSKRGRKRRVIVDIESPIQDSQGASRGKTAEVFETDSMKGVEMAIDELPSSVSDDQPLSMWFEGMHSPTTVDGSRVSPCRTVQQYTVTNERKKEIAMQYPAVDANGDIVPDDNRGLPFVKTFPLWETIESMEVFQVMPQRPHFHPLYSCKETSREGLAIGCMVTFSSVVKKTSELHFDDPRSVIEDNLETLLDLENHGFAVEMVRDRLTGLLLIKDEQEKFQDRSKEVRSWMVEQNHEKTKIDEEIDEIDKKIRELQEKRSSSMSMKKIKDSEIASLQSRVDAINEDIKSIQLDFEGLTAAPW